VAKKLDPQAKCLQYNMVRVERSTLISRMTNKGRANNRAGNMKRRIYVEAHEAETMKETPEVSQVTSEEHASLIEKRYAERFRSKDSLISWYLSENERKLPALDFLTKYIKEKNFSNILSLGAGPCVLEYLLKSALPELKVVATDYDSLFIRKAKILLPEIIPIEFDFFKDKIADLWASLGIRFDIAVFFGSSYVMDDPQFVNLFRGLKDAGVKRVIDFCGGYMDLKEVVCSALLPVRRSASLRKLFRKPPLNLRKFHGYARSRGELRRLYREAGFSVLQERPIGGYKYVAILACKVFEISIRSWEMMIPNDKQDHDNCWKNRKLEV